MHTFLKSNSLLLASFALTAPLSAQSESVLDQLSQDLHNPEKYSLSAIEEEALFAPASDGDSDLGEQLILRRPNKKGSILASWDTHLIHSNNITNSDTNTSSGFLFNSRLNVGWIRPINDNLFVSLSATESVYHYETQNDLDFWNTRASAGIVKIFSEHDIVFTADIVHNYARRNLISDKIHSITSLRLGASRTFFINPDTSAFVGIDLGFDLESSSVSAERNEYTLRLGYSKRLTEKLTATFFGDISNYDYELNDRSDTNYAVGVSLEYGITSNITAFSSFTYVNNDSDQAGFDYSTTLGSIGVGLKASF